MGFIGLGSMPNITSYLDWLKSTLAGVAGE